MVESNLLKVERRSDVVWLTLDSPQNLNALSADLLRALERELDVLHREEGVRCVVITGAGRAFSAGGDLAAFRSDLADPTGESLLKRLAYAQAVFDKVEALPMPVIAAVNGVAVAGGLELILCCDIVLAAASSKLGDGHARYGIIPAGGASTRLPKKIAPNRANMMFFSADLFTAHQLQDWGLVNEVVPDERLLETATHYAEAFAAHSPLGLALTKQLARNGAELPTPEGLKAELEAFRGYLSSADFAEGLEAFSQKRRPVFKGV